MKNRKMIFAPIMVFMAVLLAVSLASTGSEITNESTMPNQTVIFDVQNMNCASCPITVRLAMEKVDGVIDVSIDYKLKTASVLFDTSVTSDSDIAAASTSVGYPAQLQGKPAS